jgi:hypothetical protein
MKPWTLALLVF